MTDSTLFNDAPTSVLETLVGEGKKFKDPELLAKAKLESDQFIEQLKAENKTLRDEMQQKVRLEELLKRIEEKTRDTSSSRNQPPYETEQDDEDNPNPSLTNEDLERLIEQKYNQIETRKTAQQNLDATKQKLKELLGDNWTEKLKTRITQLGLNEKTLDTLASQSPQAALNALGLSGTQTSGFYSPPSSSVSQNLNTQGTSRNKAYYDKIKESDPKTYWSQKVQAQMHKDALKLAEDFFN